MLTSDICRALALSVLGVAVLMDRASIGLIIAVAMVEVVFTMGFDPSHNGALRQIVPEPQLGEAVARNEARAYGASLLGPPLGGVLFAAGRPLPFLADAISYLASFLLLARIRSPFQAERRQQSGEGAQERASRSMLAGWTFVRKDAFLRALAIVAPLLNAAIAGILFVVVVTLKSAGVSASMIGLVQAAAGLGGLAGALVTPQLQRRLSAPTIIMAAFWLSGLSALSMAIAPGSIAVAVPLSLLLMLAPPANATLMGYQIAITPDDLQGRVNSVIMFLASSLLPLAPLVGGLVVDHSGGRAALLALAGVIGSACIVVTTSRGVRGMSTLSQEGR